ncbi:MAG: D-alanyl-D-alanine carboxypeptidase/D-alanyl-D-alanine-endopeptidase [Ideonella sp. MAG2]|nr:MAG: D-alanyl-D-alanine carboxypeptidase/D-alanyl-D-alanine-endopeptidase [Ideonella sp. MAG2]
MWKSVADCAPARPTALGGLRRRDCVAALAAGACWPSTAPAAALDEALNKLPERCGLPSHSVGLYARVVGQAQPLVAINAEQPFQMASTAKLVTSMAALDVLGPEFRWRTAAYLDGELRDGTLWGDLWLVARLAVAQAWARVGGRLTGAVVEQAVGPRAPQLFAVHQSERLPALLREINKTSDNLAARHLMLAMSPGFPKQAATLPAAQRRMQQWLAQQGLARGDIEVDSGSGLSRQERAKPRALAALLERFAYHPQGMALLSSLPLAGVDGTMQHRLRGGAAQGQAYLKTGTLMDTRALAGYIKTRSGHVVVVTALINHPQADRATGQMDGCIEWLARYA